MPLKESNPEPPRKCSWHRHSLRTLLVFVLLACMSWLGVRLWQAIRQRAAVETIIKLGGFVTYDYMLDQSGNQLPDAQSPGPECLRKLLGDDFFTRVVRVNLDSTEVTDADLEHLECLTQLQWLNLFNTGVTDAGLEHLKGLTQLQRLELGGATKVTDAGLEHLKGLTELGGLFLGGTKVTEEGEKKLQQALPKWLR